MGIRPPQPFRLSLAISLVIAVPLASSAQSIFTVVGGGTDDGRPATLAALDSPYELTLDMDGNLYVAVASHFRVRRVDRQTGIISLVAGNGFQGYGGDGGPATKAELSFPWAVETDSAGNVFIADGKNYRIRRVDPEGIVSTYAGIGTAGYSGDGGPASRAEMQQAVGLAIDAGDNLFFCDSRNHRIRRVDHATGIITTVAGGGEGEPNGIPATQAAIIWPEGVAVDRHGNLYIATINSVAFRVDGASGIVTKIAGTSYGYSGDGGPATSAQLGNPEGIAVDLTGNVYIADTANHRVRRIDAASGVITTVAGSGPTTGPGVRGDYAGDGGPATAARLDQPRGVRIDPDGTLFIADSSNDRVRRVDPTGLITTFAGNGDPTFRGDHGPATSALLDIESPIGRTGGTAVDGAGNLYIADSGNQIVRRVDIDTGVIRTVAGSGVQDCEGCNTGDGGPATEAALNDPGLIAVDRAGTRLYIGDFARIRVVDLATGIITNHAGTEHEGFSGDGGPATMAQLDYVNEMIVDSQGNLFFADTGNFRIRRIDGASGIISTITQGGYRNNFGWSRPTDVAYDESRDVLYILQDQNPSSGSPYSTLIAYDMKSDTQTTLVPELPGFINSIALSVDGTLLLADGQKNLIRRVDVAPLTFTIVAGSGVRGYAGDGGPATAAAIFASLVTVDFEGGIYFANEVGSRIRYVPPCRQLEPVVLVSPGDGSSGTSITPRLQWQRPAAAQRFDVLLDTSNPPEQLAKSDIEATSFSPANLAPLTTYYWRIIARGDRNCEHPESSASPVRSFTTQSDCTPPRLDADEKRVTAATTASP